MQKATNPSSPAPERIAALEARLAAADAERAALAAELAAARAELDARRQLHEVFEQAPVGIYFLPLQGRPGEGFVSAHIERILGIRAAELLDDPGIWQRRIHPDDAPAVSEKFRQAIASCGHQSHEYRMRHPEGRWVWIYDELDVIADASGQPTHYQGFFYDISLRKEAEARARSQEERFRELVETMPAATYRAAAGGAGPMLYVSPFIKRLLGYTPEEWYLSPTLWVSRIHPDDLPQVFAAFGPAAPPGALRAAEYRMRHRDGRWVWVRDQATVVAGPGGRGSELLGFVFDISQRKQAEEAMRASEERLRTMLSGMPVMLDAFDEQGRLVVWNAECEQVTGYSATELLGRADVIERLYPAPVYREEMLAEWGVRGANFRNWELTITRKDGEQRIVAWSNVSGALPVPGWSFWSVGVDVTEQRRAEAALRESQAAVQRLNAELEQRVQERTHALERSNAALRQEVADRQEAEAALRESQRFLERVLAASPAYVNIFDYTSRRTVYTNGSYTTTLGYSQSQLDAMGDGFIVPQLMHPDDLALIPAQVQQQLAMADDEVLQREFRMRHADGSWRWFVTYDVIFDRGPDGRPTQVLGQVLEITARKRMEIELAAAIEQLDRLNAELQRSDSLLRTIVNSLADGLVLIDESGLVLMANQAVSVLCRRPPPAIVGQRWATICPFESQKIAQAIDAGLAFRGREQQRRDGVTRDFDIQAIPLASARGGHQTVLHLVDVTERLQFEALAIQNERLAAAGRLAAVVAHEVNSPLQAIQNLLFLAESDDRAERTTHLTMIGDEIDRIGGLIRRLLELQRPGDQASRQLDLNALVERVLTLTNITLARQRVLVAVALTADPTPVLGRSDQLTQVLLNLLLNALDAMPHGGDLAIRSRRRSYQPADELGRDVPAEVVEVEVADSGPGIAGEALPRIFEPFYTTKASGSGLGLAISVQIVEQHGGRLWARNRAEGGAAFILVLPVAPPDPAAPPPAP